MENNNLKNENQSNQVSQGTPVTQGNSSNQATQANIKSRKIVYYILGVLEVLFAFRLVFKILGANPQSIFNRLGYCKTN